ncbi:MAG: single-stranded DNA-binding protein [Spirochaetes bacterium RIFOXYC1_FULL_54_7]|nr:MAG: single-stranded DNA-binding protein [Spirochaetes bacterium RIFOXYC1_FULL_54_7]
MLSNLNSIIIEGNLVRDPLLKATPNGHPVCSFAVASNRFYKQNEDTEKEVSFFDIETWSKLAQTCGDVLKKGRGVRVVGRLKQDRWTDNGGKNQSRIKIVAEHVEFKPVFRKETDPQGISEAAENGMETYAEEREPEAEAVF